MRTLALTVQENPDLMTRVRAVMYQGYRLIRKPYGWVVRRPDHSLVTLGGHFVFSAREARDVVNYDIKN